MTTSSPCHLRGACGYAQHPLHQDRRYEPMIDGMMVARLAFRRSNTETGFPKGAIPAERQREHVPHRDAVSREVEHYEGPDISLGRTMQ